MIHAVLLLAGLLSLNSAAANPSFAGTNAIPPQVMTTWNQAVRELRRTESFREEGALDDEAIAKRRAAIRRAFVRVCRAKGIPEATIKQCLAQLAL